jgi:hypothetical protein
MKQEQKDFMAIQKDFFGGVLKMYLVPVKIVLSFFGILGEMLRQMLISLMMNSEDFQVLQDLKFEKESNLHFLEEEEEE